MAYDDLDDAIAGINASEYGRGGTVWVNKHLDLPFDVPNRIEPAIGEINFRFGPRIILDRDYTGLIGIQTCLSEPGLAGDRRAVVGRAIQHEAALPRQCGQTPTCRRSAIE
jgi:hypothetical protein